MDSIFVLCHDREDFKRWCIDNSLNPRDNDLVQVQDSRNLRGYWIQQLEITRYFWDRQDAVWLYDEALSRLDPKNHIVRQW